MMNRFISIFLATALLCAFDPPAALFAQEAGGAISGKVISAEDGRPIEFAVISLLPSRIYTTTGSDGSYLIENIPAGEVTVEASFFGMSTESREISVTAGKDYVLDFSLSEVSFRMQEVTVTATRDEAGKATASKISRQAMDHLQASSLGEEEQDAKYILSKEVVGIDVEYVEPVLAFSAGVDYTSRDDLSFSVGAAPEAWAESPETVWEVNIARNQGGDYPMQGSGFDSEIEFGFDASPIADEAFAMEDVTWFLGVTRNVRGSEGGSGRVTSFKVYDYRGGEDNPTVHTAVLPEDSGIRSGTNWYALRTAEPETTSASPVEWLQADGQPVKATFIVRTADGGYAKVRFSEYDRKNGKINLRYVYTSDSHLGH